ncbi:MAG: YajQ family cyclic di-GMP-binding protein [Nitrospirae bacterium]|uniref:YajQ family cyclic di-GMP-binding protein n=1 Tax=Candidatus Magnetobacterium casense TaxID=1455061 RepID=UPI00058AE1B4|nr:YajQ family cyclic di-GMP-binding protein [Candidatus Magnetobacterium casensis]MBF0336525.1 YajQ family cyclic di-GMP-binding protein [Nitrospirota bacterium]
MAADEHSFDITCEVNLQEVSNAVTQALKELSTRFDFKGSKSEIDIDKANNVLSVVSDDEYKLKSVLDILQTKLVKRGVALKALTYGKIEPAAGGTVRQKISLQQGIPIEKAKEITKLVKELKLKVTAEIQNDQVRIRGKKIDDLQNIISRIKDKDFGIHIQISNYR